MTITTEALRNIAVAGHGTTGKTILVESMLYSAGAIPRAESIESGKTVSDYTEEEIARKYSIRTSLTHAVWNDRKMNILDTPGASDFVGEVVAAFRAAESTIIVIAGVTMALLTLFLNSFLRSRKRAVAS